MSDRSRAQKYYHSSFISRLTPVWLLSGITCFNTMFTVQIQYSIKDAGDKMKAASKAAATKAKDPETDIDTEYQKEKIKEGTSEKSPADSTKSSKLIPSSIPQSREYWYQMTALNLPITH